MSTDVRVSRSLKDLVSEEIRAMMGRRRMSANALARALDKSDMYVSRRLRGATPFDVDDLELIAQVLDVQVTDLLPARRTRSHVTAENHASRPSSRTDSRRPRDGRTSNIPSAVRRPRVLSTEFAA